MLMLQLRR